MCLGKYPTLLLPLAKSPLQAIWNIGSKRIAGRMGPIHHHAPPMATTLARERKSLFEEDFRPFEVVKLYYVVAPTAGAAWGCFHLSGAMVDQFGSNASMHDAIITFLSAGTVGGLIGWYGMVFMPFILIYDAGTYLLYCGKASREQRVHASSIRVAL